MTVYVSRSRRVTHLWPMPCRTFQSCKNIGVSTNFQTSQLRQPAVTPSNAAETFLSFLNFINKCKISQNIRQRNLQLKYKLPVDESCSEVIFCLIVYNCEPVLNCLQLPLKSQCKVLNFTEALFSQQQA